VPNRLAIFAAAWLDLLMPLFADRAAEKKLGALYLGRSIPLKSKTVFGFIEISSL